MMINGTVACAASYFIAWAIKELMGDLEMCGTPASTDYSFTSAASYRGGGRGAWSTLRLWRVYGFTPWNFYIRVRI